MYENYFKYKGKKEDIPKIGDTLKEKGIDKKTLYIILKNFEINPKMLETLISEFPFD